MLKIYISLFILSVGTAFASAQKCATSVKVQEKLANNPELESYRNALNTYTQLFALEQDAKATTEVVTLPMVVHVLHTGGADNISDAQIISQISVLNNDFRKLNANFSSTPMAFQSLAADVEIEFCLASINPNGNTTTGITRKQVASSFDWENDYYTNAGTLAWDNSKYINVWIVDLGSGLLGFATPPGTANNGDDGIVIDDNAWGTIETAANNQPNHLGRTATHEFGHYFNLEHVWGPTNGGCGEDDFVGDTPAQFADSFGCPSFPETDDCTNSGNGIMYVNYMDYSDDDCMSMFTIGQKTRMLAALNGPRSGLKSSNGCGGNPTDISVNPEENLLLDIYPNPSNQAFVVNFKDFMGGNLSIFDLNGKLVHRQNLELQKTTLNLGTLDIGVYYIRVENPIKGVVETEKLIIK